jgi:LL-diaminopimelate aminotransferase
MGIESARRLRGIEEYYFSQKLEQIAKMNREGCSVINLGIGSPDMEPQRNVIAAFQEAIVQPGVHGYQGYKGIPDLRKAIAHWALDIYQTKLDPETEILPLMGSKEGIMHISLAYLNEGDAVLVPDPGYPTYTSVSKLVRAKVVTYDMDSETGINLDQVTRLTKENNVKIIWINFPHMPTGVRANLNTLRKLVDLARAKGILLVNDNPYSTVLTEDFVSIFQVEGAKEVCLELNSLSKSHNMAGWRIGWLSGNAELIRTVLKVKSNMDSGMFQPLQKAAVEALLTGKEQIENSNETYRARRKLAWDLFDKLGCSYSQSNAGMFVWGKQKAGTGSSAEFSDRILSEANVFITPGFIFGRNGEGYQRISLCSSENVFRQAIERLQTISQTKQATP